MLLETLSRGLNKIRATNTTDSSFPSRVPTHTKPSGTGNAAAQTTSAVLDLLAGGRYIQNTLLLCPYATATNNQTFSMRVIGWRVVGESNSLTSLWIPVLLNQFTCTVSSAIPGVTGMTIVPGELFADTITGPSANPGAFSWINSPADDSSIAHVLVDLEGFQMAEVTFTTGSSATDCNALYSML